MLKATPLNAVHRAAGARMVDFGGWDMPVNYGSQIEEHHAVRRDAGMFDVSHMLALDLAGAGSKAYLRGLIANDVAKLAEPGKALYSCMLNPEGGVIDDLIVSFLSDTEYRIVVNAGTADKDVAWMQERLAASGLEATLTVRRDLAMIAVQGPNARAKTWAALPGSEAASAGPYAIVTGGERWRPMLMRLARDLGLDGALAAIHTVAPSGAQLAADPDGATRLLAAACREAAALPGVQRVVLGGAGLAGIAARLQPEVPVPVIDSVQAGVRQALGLSPGSGRAADGFDVTWSGVSPELAALGRR